MSGREDMGVWERQTVNGVRAETLLLTVTTFHERGA